MCHVWRELVEFIEHSLGQEGNNTSISFSEWLEKLQQKQNIQESKTHTVKFHNYTHTHTHK